MAVKYLALLIGFVLFSLCYTFGLSDHVTEITWTSDAACVIQECRLDSKSVTYQILTSSCARERCSIPLKVTSSFEILLERKFALVLHDYDLTTVQQVISVLDGIDLFVMSMGNNKSDKSALFDIYENGEKIFSDLDIKKALRRGTFGGIRSLSVGPIQSITSQLLQRKMTLAECARILRRNSIGIIEDDLLDITDQMMELCVESDFFQDVDDDEEDDQETDYSRDELWVKARQLGLVSNTTVLTAIQHVQGLWKDIFDNAKNKYWLSISWVPVFDYLHRGLGYGDRFEALLLELIQVDEMETANPNDPQRIISTQGGKKSQVKWRKLAALIACDDDELESVLRCIRGAVPNIFMVDQIVWGMGFVGDDNNYSELKEDWNADPIYSSGGQIPKKFEDEPLMSPSDEDNEDIKDEL